MTGVACAGPPIVANDLRESIHVSSEYRDGEVRLQTVLPDRRIYLSDFRKHPIRVTISLPGGADETFTEADTPRLVGSRVVGDVVGWRVTRDGVVPLVETPIDM